MRDRSTSFISFSVAARPIPALALLAPCMPFIYAISCFLISLQAMFSP